MNDLKKIKQAVVSYGLYFPFVRGMVEMWTSSNKATPHHWLVLMGYKEGLGWGGRESH